MLFVFTIGVLREIPEDDGDLVFHVDRGVAVVSEALALGNDDAVAGEHRRARRVAVVGKRQRPDPAVGGSAVPAVQGVNTAGCVGSFEHVSSSVVPPSRVPAVNSKGNRKSVAPGSGFAPMRWSSDAR